MCTVTLVPVKDGFYLTTNRDEQTDRGISEWPKVYNHSFGRLLYPRDPKGKGTWIAADESLNLICLLNGAYEPHNSKFKYRKSRGLVVLDVFSFKSIDDFYKVYDLHDIEPFTLVGVWVGGLIEFVWDGMKKDLITEPVKEPKIWSSVTLYSQDVITKKEKLFKDWISNQRKLDRESILSFHLSENPEDQANAIKMKRPDVQTLSVTSVSVINNRLSMLHYDLVNDKIRSLGFDDKTIEA